MNVTVDISDKDLEQLKYLYNEDDIQSIINKVLNDALEKKKKINIDDFFGKVDLDINLHELRKR